MNNVQNLSQFAFFVNDKILSEELTLDEYVTTDNLLQDKQGKVRADSLPAQSSNVTKYSKGDILLSNIRPYLKKIWYADTAGGCSADVLVLRAFPHIEPRFLYYVLLRDDFFNHVMRGSKGTKMPRGDKSHIMDFVVPNFTLQKQSKISNLLTLLDTKIALNNRINSELEEMAKTLYDYWFVQFDFPDANGNPYKTSGGKMVYNPILKRDIPEGWSDKTLSEIANITMGQSPEGCSYNEEGNGTVFFQGSTDFGWLFPTTRQYTTAPARMAKKGDILLSVRAPVGDMNIANSDCCIGRGLAALNSKSGSDGFLFYVMKYFKQIFDRRNSEGTTFGSITKTDLHTLILAHPTTDLLKKYDDIVSNYNKMIFERSLENQELIKLRDWLLPMLMNGQVTVK
ncbi:restriction endonuclease subunit S [Xenorhabdus nematophila]|uniref:restriction endonuclease subunit S n=1 Tax=Xenorhabdus nematophila TaxID=628 RepID=UPI0032B82643